MTLFALTPETSDFLTFWGFVAGVLGCVVGILGFGYTIYQVLKVKAVAEAAAEAANKTLAESKESYERFVGGYATRLLSELQKAVDDKAWELAMIRCQDLADLIATLPPTGNEAMQNSVRESVKNLRDFRQTFAELVGDDTAKLVPKVKNKWIPLLHVLHSRLDQLRAPFRESHHGQVSPSNPVRTVPGDRPQPRDENESRPGDLGAPIGPERDP